MIYEYVIDPELLCDQIELDMFLQQFNAKNPDRKIACIPKSWRRMVYDQIEGLTLPDVKKAKYKNKFANCIQSNAIKKRPTRVMRLEEETWIYAVEKEHKAHQFSAVFSRCKSTNIPVYEFSNLNFDEPKQWSEPNEKSIIGTASQIVEVILPLLKLSKRICFYDPFFNFLSSSDYLPFLNELIAQREFFYYGRGVNEIEIHFTKYERGDKVFKHNLEYKLPKNFSVKFFQWEPKGPDNERHDRFFVTEVGGITSGKGFAETKGEKRKFSVMEKITADEALASITASEDNRPLSKFTIIGRKG
jgi:hypothetical protein